MVYGNSSKHGIWSHPTPLSETETVHWLGLSATLLAGPIESYVFTVLPVRTKTLEKYGRVASAH